MNLTDEQHTAIRRAVHDPGAVVGKRYGPSWGRGNDGYAEEQESLWLWVVRAVEATVGRELAKANGSTDRMKSRLECAEVELQRWRDGDGTWRSLVFSYVHAEEGSDACSQAWHEMRSAVKHFEAVERRRPEPTPVDELDAVRAAFPVGTKVFYWPGVREGEGRPGTTIEPVRQYSNGLCVRIETADGGTDRIALTHVQHWTDEPGRIVPLMTLEARRS